MASRHSGNPGQVVDAQVLSKMYAQVTDHAIDEHAEPWPDTAALREGVYDVPDPAYERPDVGRRVHHAPNVQSLPDRSTLKMRIVSDHKHRTRLASRV